MSRHLRPVFYSLSARSWVSVDASTVPANGVDNRRLLGIDGASRTPPVPLESGLLAGGDSVGAGPTSSALNPPVVGLVPASYRTVPKDMR